jgi:hypothetical protein
MPAQRVREPQAACLLAGLATFGAAACLAAVVWATYDALDHSGFDMHAAVVVPMLSALRIGAVQPAGLHRVAMASGSPVAGGLL